MTIVDMIGKYYRWFNVLSKPLKDDLVLGFLVEDLKKYTWIDSMEGQIVPQKKALYELMLWLETIENKEHIDHGMVLLFRYLQHVIPNCANLNNTDKVFFGFANKHLFYDDDDDEHLPIPVYSGIKLSMGASFILNPLLSLGRLSIESELFLNDTLRGCFPNAKLVGEEDDTESLQNYSNQVMNIFVNNQLVFFQMVNV